MLHNNRFIALTLLALLAATPSLAAYPASPPDKETNDLPLLVAHADSQAGIENLQERRDAVTTEEVSPLTLKLGDSRFTLHGLIEAEASLLHPEGGTETDDLRLSTVQIGLEAELTPWLGGHVIGLWEDEDTEPMAIDEAVLTLTFPRHPLGQTPALHLGRQYLPFGTFNSNMISDPLTLELGETHTTASVLSMAGELWTAKVGAFEGSIEHGDDGIDSWVAAVEMTPHPGVTMGASWISDLAESDAELVQDEELYRDEVPGWSAFVALQHGPYGLTAEYLAATKRFKSEQVATSENLTGRKPEAWNLELTWQPARRVQVAARYEAAHDYQDNVSRYGATVSFGLCDFALLGFEYLHADADNTSPEHAFTAQLAVEF